MKFIGEPWKIKANYSYSCFANTISHGFDRSPARDDVSFYKPLARIESAKKMGVTVDEYDRRL